MSSDIWLHFSVLLSVSLCLGFAVSHWFLSNSGKGCFVADPWQRKLFLFYQRWSVLIAWNPIRSKGWILSTFSRSYRYTENSAKLISDALMCLMHLRKVLMKRLSGLLKVCSVSLGGPSHTHMQCWRFPVITVSGFHTLQNSKRWHDVCDLSLKNVFIAAWKRVSNISIS